MKGYLYYSTAEATRNRAFIDDLINEASKAEIMLQLLVSGQSPTAPVDFILFRDRDPNLALEWESAGFRLFNRAEVNRIANDKSVTADLSLLLGIPTVPTKKVNNPNQILSYPCVLKTVDGHGGNEVILCKTIKQATSFMEHYKEHQIILQPFIETGAQDVRVFMLGTEVLGAVKWTGNGSFKSNYTLGGSAEAYTLNGWQEKVAVKIAKAIKSDYIGIDFLLLPDGSWLLNELEDPVGARSLYATHSFSVAEKVIQYIKDKVEDNLS